MVFVRSGRIALTVAADTFGYAGIGGYYWSSRSSDMRYDGVAIPSGYNFRFYTTGAGSSGGPDPRSFGFPLRCLSTVLGMGGDVAKAHLTGGLHKGIY